MTTRSGYAVTIRGFIPVDPSDLDGHAKVLEAIREAKQAPAPLIDVPVVIKKEGDVEEPFDMSASADKMFAVMEVETFDVRPVTRRAKGEGAAS